MTYHEAFEALGMTTAAVALLLPVYGTIWELSKAYHSRARK